MYYVIVFVVGVLLGAGVTAVYVYKKRDWIAGKVAAVESRIAKVKAVIVEVKAYVTKVVAFFKGSK